MATKIVILGAGESGVGAALLAKQKGYNVFVSDASAIKPIYQSELEAIKFHMNLAPMMLKEYWLLTK